MGLQIGGRLICRVAYREHRGVALRHSYEKTFSVEYSLQCVMLRKVCSLAICEHEHLVLKLCQGGSPSLGKQKRQSIGEKGTCIVCQQPKKGP